MVRGRKEQLSTQGGSTGDVLEVSGTTYQFASNISSLSETLSLGNTTDGYSISISDGDDIRAPDGYINLNYITTGLYADGAIRFQEDSITFIEIDSNAITAFDGYLVLNILSGTPDRQVNFQSNSSNRVIFDYVPNSATANTIAPSVFGTVDTEIILDGDTNNILIDVAENNSGATPKIFAIFGQSSFSTSDGGDILISSGYNFFASGSAGTLSIMGGSAFTDAGGDVNIAGGIGGAGGGAGNGGTTRLSSGTAAGAGADGDIYINHNSGQLFITDSLSATSYLIIDRSSINFNTTPIIGGDPNSVIGFASSNVVEKGKDLTISSQASATGSFKGGALVGIAGNSLGGTGGIITLTAGDSTAGDGGSIFLIPGTSDGAGADGYIDVANTDGYVSKIINVADGTNTNDAVNFGQLTSSLLSAPLNPAEDFQVAYAAGGDLVYASGVTVVGSETALDITGYIDFSGGTVTNGTIRLPNNSYIISEDTGGADVAVFALTSSDILQIGSNTAALDGIDLSLPPGDSLRVLVAGTPEYTFNSTDANFSANNILTTGYVQIGSDPAASGSVRLDYDGYITSNNAAGSADINLIGLTSTNKISIGDDATETFIECNSNRIVNVGPILSFNPNANPIIIIAPEDTDDASGDTFLVSAGDSTGASNDGGALILSSGEAGAGGTAGTVSVRIGDSDTVTTWSGADVDFQDTNILTTGFIDLSNAATASGDIRLPDGGSIKVDRAGATMTLIDYNDALASVITIGNLTRRILLRGNTASDGVTISAGSGNTYNFGDTAFDADDKNILTTGYLRINDAAGDVTTGDIRLGDGWSIVATNNDGLEATVAAMNGSGGTAQLRIGQTVATFDRVEILGPNQVRISTSGTERARFTDTIINFENDLDMQTNDIIDITNVTAAGYLEIGNGSYPSTGDIRIGHTDPTIYTKDDSDTLDYHLLSRSSDGYNDTVLGDGIERMKINADSIFIGNSSAPTDNPVSGGYIYVESSAGIWRDDAGALTTFGAVESGDGYEHLAHLHTRGAAQTDNDMEATVCFVTPDTSTDGTIMVWAIVQARENDGTGGMLWRMSAQGYIDGGSITINGTVGGTTAELDPDTKGWTVDIDTSAGDIRLLGTGVIGDTVRWQARMWVDITAFDMSVA